MFATWIEITKIFSAGHFYHASPKQVADHSYFCAFFTFIQRIEWKKASLSRLTKSTKQSKLSRASRSLLSRYHFVPTVSSLVRGFQFGAEWSGVPGSATLQALSESVMAISGVSLLATPSLILLLVHAGVTVLKLVLFCTRTVPGLAARVANGLGWVARPCLLAALRELCYFSKIPSLEATME